MNNIKTRGWSWIPSIYYAEGLPYAIVIIVSTIMYKNQLIVNMLHFKLAAFEINNLTQKGQKQID